MPTTLESRTKTLSPNVPRIADATKTGLRLWDRDEYYRMGELDIFGDDRVELLRGEIWYTFSSDLYRWTSDQYHRLIEAGFFEDGRVELLGGLIWDMTGQLTPHTTGMRLTTLVLEEVFSSGYEVRSQLPIVLPDGTEPEPDVAVALGTPLDYANHHPGNDELLLIVEVSDSTLTKDRGPKLVGYARGWIAEYWIVNLVNRQLEVYREPSPAGIYAESRVYLPGESVEPLNAPGKSVTVADLLPPVKQEL